VPCGLDALACPDPRLTPDVWDDPHYKAHAPCKVHIRVTEQTSADCSSQPPREA
jgi:hypothetical protein